MQMWIKAASERFGRSDIRPFSEKLAPDLQQKWLARCRRASVQSMHEKTRRSSIRQRSKRNEAHASFGRHSPTVEMAARGITGIGRHGLSIMTDLTLPDFGEPTKLAWPPPTVP